MWKRRCRRSSELRCCRRPPSSTRRSSPGSCATSSATGGSVPATSPRSPSRAPTSPARWGRTASSSSAARTDGHAPSTTSAATAAPASSRRMEGSVRKRLRCPYHAWSYDLEGNLRAAPHMDEVRGLRPLVLRPARGAQRGDRRPRAGRPGRRGWARRGPSRGAAPAPRALQRREPAARRPPHLRGEGELEGHRRELQRVPALPRGASGAEHAQRLHERRGATTAPAPGAAAR